jgi:hypothetical protein
MLDGVVQLQRKIRDDQVITKLQAARWGDIEAVGSWFQKDLEVVNIAASDVSSVGLGAMHQVPVVLELLDGLFLSDNFHVTQSHGCCEVL